MWTFCDRLALIGLVWAGIHTGNTWARERLVEEFHQAYPLATNGEIRVENVNGRVRITAWERVEVQVDAVKSADTEADLKATRIVIDSHAGAISLRTKQPDAGSGWKWWRGRHNSPSVDYDLKVPAGARLKKIENVNGGVDIKSVTGAVHAGTVNGRLELESVRGEVHAETVNGHLRATGLAANARLNTVNGAIEAAFDSLSGVKSVSLETVNGAVQLSLPASANAEISATTLNGGIKADSPLAVKKDWPVGTELHCKLGQGGAHIKANTVNGAIRVRLVGPPQPVQVERE